MRFAAWYASYASFVCVNSAIVFSCCSVNAFTRCSKPEISPSDLALYASNEDVVDANASTFVFNSRSRSLRSDLHFSSSSCVALSVD